MDPHGLGATTNRSSESGFSIRGPSCSAGAFGRVAGLIRGGQNSTHLFTSEAGTHGAPLVAWQQPRRSTGSRVRRSSGYRAGAAGRVGAEEVPYRDQARPTTAVGLVAPWNTYSTGLLDRRLLLPWAMGDIRFAGIYSTRPRSNAHRAPQRPAARRPPTPTPSHTPRSQ